MNTLSRWACVVAVAGICAMCGPAGADQISLNFSENSGNQFFDGGQSIGPLLTDSSNWNNTNGEPDLTAGAMVNLIDDSGANTGASVTWAASNVYWNSDGTADDEHRMAVGYLDDGETSAGIGVDISFTNIPYTNYRVYGLVTNGDSTQYDTLDFMVNGTSVFGAATAPAYGGIDESMAQTGQFWSHADGTTRGNYWTTDTTGSTLTITGLPRNGAERGSITAVIVASLDTPIFDPLMKLSIDRGSGQITMTNNTGSTVDIAGTGILSEAGSMDPGNWMSISEFYDEGGLVSNDEWIVFSNSATDLSEGTLGTGALTHSQSVNLGTGVWKKSPYEDVRFEYLDANTGEVFSGLIEYSGTPIEFGDFNGDGFINEVDWPTLRDGFNTDLSGMAIAEAYFFGDITGDLVVNSSDLFAFQVLFDAANGDGAFGAMLAGVPEPATCSLLLICLIGLGIGSARRQVRRATPFIAVVVAVTWMAGGASAVSIGVNFATGQWEPDFPTILVGPNEVAGTIPQTNWNNSVRVPGGTSATGSETDLVDYAGDVTTADVTWEAADMWGGIADGSTTTGNQHLLDHWIDDGSASVTVTNIPYATYDAYVYYSSDAGNGGRRARHEINGVEYLSVGTWQDPLSPPGYYYFELVGHVDGASGDPNPSYAVAENLTSSTLTVTGQRDNEFPGGVVRGVIAGIQIVDTSANPFLTLRVDPDTGVTEIRNDTGVGHAIDYYEITSESFSLNESGWNPLGSGTNDGSDWEVLGNLDDSILAQFYLQGSEMIGDGESLPLGAAVAPGSPSDLAFAYRVDGMGTSVIGAIEFGPVAGLNDADFNDDGIVDGDDFLIWQTGFGGPGDQFTGDANGDGVVDGDDFLQWQQDFGGPPSGGASAAVPEPSTFGLLSLMLIGLTIGWIRRKNGGQIMKRGMLTAIVISLSIATAAMASSTNDRLYFLGDDDGGVIPGGTVGTTVDSEAPLSGTQQDLSTLWGTQTYVNVGSDGIGRPGAGSGELGIRFDASNEDVLFGDRLGDPETTASSTGGFGPLDYTGIANRGFQLWVYADVAGGVAQDVVMDTNQHGFRINAAGNWEMRFNGVDVDSGIAVNTDQWYHVMVVRPFGPSGPNNGARMYVDGEAVAARAGGYDGADETVLAVGANTGDFFDGNPGDANWFDGVLDDLEMFVMGTSDVDGIDYGTFHLAEDNPIVAATWGGKPDGDMDGDGDVDDADVALFIPNWRAENIVNGIAAGDINTRENGDFNYDGLTNFSDWFLLRANHADPGSLNLRDLLGGVPEPSSALLALVGIVALLGSRRPRLEWAPIGVGKAEETPIIPPTVGGNRFGTYGLAMNGPRG